MNLLLDTHNQALLSVASVWEIAIKKALGKLDAPNDLPHAMNVSAFLFLPVETRHALGVGDLPPHHGDPFDRMLVAQARCEGLTLVGADPWVSKYDVPVLPAA